MQIATEVKDNPYVALVARKQRNLKKKHEKIMKIEAQLQSGKQLDGEQLVLYNSKNSVERSIADLQGLQVQMEELAKEAASHNGEAVEESKTGNDGRAYHSNSPAPAVVDPATAASPSAQFPLNEKPAAATAEVAKSIAAASEEVSAVEWIVVVPEIAPSEPSSAAEVDNSVQQSEQMPAVVQYSDAERYVLKLLKALHVCLRYKGKLPATVDYFGKTLLGQTSINGFQETLISSAKCCRQYLMDDEAAQCEAVRGCTYEQMSTMIDELASEMISGTKLQPAAASTAAASGANVPEGTAAASDAIPSAAAVKEAVDVATAEKIAELSATAAAADGADVEASGAAGKSKRRPRRNNRRDRKEVVASNDEQVAVIDATGAAAAELADLTEQLPLTPAAVEPPTADSLMGIKAAAIDMSAATSPTPVPAPGLAAAAPTTSTASISGSSTIGAPLFSAVGGLPPPSHNCAPPALTGAAQSFNTLQGDMLQMPSNITQQSQAAAAASADIKQVMNPSSVGGLNYSQAAPQTGLPLPFYPPPPPHLSAGALAAALGVGASGVSMNSAAIPHQDRHSMRSETSQLLMDSAQHSDHSMHSMLGDPLMNAPLFAPHLGAMDHSSLFAQLPPHMQQQHHQQMQSFQQFLLQQQQQHLQQQLQQQQQQHQYHSSGHISSATDPLPPSLSNNPPMFRSSVAPPTHSSTLQLPSASSSGRSVGDFSSDSFGIASNSSSIGMISEPPNLAARQKEAPVSAVSTTPYHQSTIGTAVATTVVSSTEPADTNSAPFETMIAAAVIEVPQQQPQQPQQQPGDESGDEKKPSRRGNRRGGKSRRGSRKRDNGEDGQETDATVAAPQLDLSFAATAVPSSNQLASTVIDTAAVAVAAPDRQQHQRGRRGSSKKETSSTEKDTTDTNIEAVDAAVAEVKSAPRKAPAAAVAASDTTENGKTSRRDRGRTREGGEQQQKKSSATATAPEVPKIPEAPKTFASILAAASAAANAAVAPVLSIPTALTPVTVAASATVLPVPSSAPAPASLVDSKKTTEITTDAAVKKRNSKSGGGNQRSSASGSASETAAADASGRKDGAQQKKPRPPRGSGRGAAGSKGPAIPSSTNAAAVPTAARDVDDFELPKRAQKKARKVPV